MREAEIPVTFQPSGKTVYVLAGTRLMEAAAAAGLVLDMPCGGEGTCGKCRLVVREGTPEPTAIERQALTASELDQGVRLACQTAVSGPCVVEVPPASLLAASHQILAPTHVAEAGPADPVVVGRYVELPPPDRTDDRADLARLQQALGPVRADLDLLRELPGRLRAGEFCGTAVVLEGDLVDFVPGKAQPPAMAVAVDVGTTTLVASLLDPRTGEERALTARLNPQTAMGDDVLARILHAQKGPEGLADLHRAITAAVDEMIGELTEQAGVSREDVYEVVFSGNTTMQQLLAGIDPRWLGEVPFVPATAGPVQTAAGRLGVRIHPRGRAYIQPVIGGFVGGDTVSGILATRLADSQGPTLLVDIGTNGEIVLAAHGKLSAASTAAGPAFEGARITHGMRASTGAIEKTVCDGRLRINVIGNVLPVGLCGSALIDLAAELLRHGIVTAEGKLLAPGQLPEGLLPDLRGRVIEQDGKPAFLLVSEDESGTGKPIVLTQRDVRELQLASGAIRAGIGILLRRAGLKPTDLDAVLVAGGFGNFIRRSNAQRIGLLPHDLPRQRIRFQGNTSLAGARMVALSRGARRLAEDLARRTEHVDLSSDPDFRWAFAEAMIFPAQ